MSNLKHSAVSTASKAQAQTPSSAMKPAIVEVLATIGYPELVLSPASADNKRVALFLVTDPDSQQALIDLVADTSEAEFRSRDLPPGAHNPLRDSNERKASGEYAFRHPAFRVEGGLVFRGKTGFEVPCVWGPSELPIEASEVQGGDLVAVQVSSYAFDNQSKGIGLSMSRIWLLEKGRTKIERGTSQANVRRIDRSRLRFGDSGDAQAVAA